MASKSKKATKPAVPDSVKRQHRADVGREIGEGALGAAAGAAVGAVAGPPGMVVGAIIGAAAGALAGAADARQGHVKDATDEELDKEIGVTEGTLGAPNLKHPPSRTGLYSRVAAGGGSAGDTHQPAEGPMSGPPAAEEE